MGKAIAVVSSVLFAVFIGASVVNGGLIGDLCSIGTSTAKIIHELCHDNGGANQRNVTLINDFFACYDLVPGKAQFEECQTKAFGGVLNTPEGVQASCRTRLTLATYLPCLSKKFKEADLELNPTVLKLNGCQARVLGIPPSRFGCNV